MRQTLIAALTLILANSGVGVEPPIVAPEEGFEQLTGDVDFAEGPAAAPDGAIYFSDIPTGPKKGRILRYDPHTGQVSDFRADSNKSNGLCFDSQGRLVACEGADHGGRRITRQTLNAASNPEVLADNFQGKKFNAPNDLCIDSHGRIWFSDPKYLGDEPRELDHRSVYRIDPDGSLHLAVTQPAIEKPNGVGIAPDGKTLYVADTNNEPVLAADGSQKKGNMQLVAFDLASDGSVRNKRVLVDYAPGAGVDGMTFDVEGNIYAAVRNPEKKGIRVYSPAGEEIAFLPTPDTPTNCTFGIGSESNRLYITTDTGFGRIRLTRRGYHPHEPATF